MAVHKRASVLCVSGLKRNQCIPAFPLISVGTPSCRFGASGHLPDSGGDQNVGAVGERRNGRLGHHQAREQGSAEAEEHGAEPAGQGAGAGHLEDAWTGTGRRDSLLAWLGASQFVFVERLGCMYEGSQFLSLMS